MVKANTLFQQHKRRFYHHKMVNTEIKSITLLTSEDGETPCSKQKQDWGLTVAQIMKSLLTNSDLNFKKWGKPLDKLRYDLK